MAPVVVPCGTTGAFAGGIMGAHVIVLGNEKGGSGKSTTAMHVFVALARAGWRCGAMDLDVRQQSFFRYLDNRAAFAERRGLALLMPERAVVQPSSKRYKDEAEAEERANFAAVLGDLITRCDVVLIDCPGSDSHLSRLGHAAADTLITPMNDSFVDFDLLAHLDPTTQEILRPSVYAEMVWEGRKARAERGMPATDWIVMRNRVSTLEANNKRRVGVMLEKLSRRLGFRVAPGFCERTIYRELFLNGLTLLDLRDPGADVEVNMGHVAARQEVRELIAHLRLPLAADTGPVEEGVVE